VIAREEKTGALIRRVLIRAYAMQVGDLGSISSSSRTKIGIQLPCLTS